MESRQEGMDPSRSCIILYGLYDAQCSLLARSAILRSLICFCSKDGNQQMVSLKTKIYRCSTTHEQVSDNSNLWSKYAINYITFPFCTPHEYSVSGDASSNIYLLSRLTGCSTSSHKK